MIGFTWHCFREGVREGEEGWLRGLEVNEVEMDSFESKVACLGGQMHD